MPLSNEHIQDVAFQREAVQAWFQEGLPLFEQHRKEVSHYPDILLDIDIQSYIQAEAIGALRCYTARVAGRLVGYIVLGVHRNIRYKGSLQAVQDVLYLDPSLRGYGYGRKLIEYAEASLRSEGVQVVYQHVKAARREGVLMKRCGYELVDHVWAKRLDR